MAKLSLRTGLPYFRLIQAVLIFSETLLLGVLYIVLRRVAPTKHPLVLVFLGVSINPICILLICQHCNFDVIIVLCILLSLAMLFEFSKTQEPTSWLLACLFLGVGVQAKTIPGVLAPLLLLSFQKLRFSTKALGVILFVGPATLAVTTVWALGAADYPLKIFQYRSTVGCFGIPAVLGLLEVPQLLSGYTRYFEVLYFALMGLTAVWIFYRGQLTAKQITSIALMLLIIPLGFGPGYADQYLYWIVPLCVLHYALGDHRTRITLLFFYAIACATYVVQYGFIPSHGAFIPALVKTDRVALIAIQLGNVEQFIRFPLFAAYIALSVAVMIPIAVEVATDLKRIWDSINRWRTK